MLLEGPSSRQSPLKPSSALPPPQTRAIGSRAGAAPVLLVDQETLSAT
jgi:hypothetical protein